MNVLKDLWDFILSFFRGFSKSPKGPPPPPPLDDPPPETPAPIAKPLPTQGNDMSSPGAAGSIAWYNYFWDEMNPTTDPNKQQELVRTCMKIEENRTRYEAVSRVTGVPWDLIAALHSRESSLDFHTCLHNGDPLDRPTTHVPAGRGPFATWELGADDALKYDGLAGRSGWTIPMMLQMAEKYNGTGYLRKGVMSPYIWSYTDQYHGGKYTSDGHYSASAYDDQIGVAAILKELRLRGSV